MMIFYEESPGRFSGLSFFPDGTFLTSSPQVQHNGIAWTQNASLPYLQKPPLSPIGITIVTPSEVEGSQVIQLLPAKSCHAESLSSEP